MVSALLGLLAALVFMGALVGLGQFALAWARAWDAETVARKRRKGWEEGIK